MWGTDHKSSLEVHAMDLLSKRISDIDGMLGGSEKIITESEKNVMKKLRGWLDINKKSVVAIIPARGGSKGLPGKNLYPVLNKPLIEWTFKQSLSASNIDYTFVSTDDEKITRLAENCGVKTILRPDNLCRDDSTSESALHHAIENIKSEHQILADIIVFLQATSPLRLYDDIDNAVSLFNKEEADSLFSATRPSDLTLWEKENESWRSVNFDYQNRLRRQDMPKNYIENGSIYIFKPEILDNHNNRLGGKIIAYEMQFWQTWEIDTIHEIDLIEFYMKKYKLDQDGKN